RAADTKAADKKSAERKSADVAPGDRPPLKLSVDSKPIDREAPDRVSYAKIVKKTEGNVVYVHSTKTVKGADLSELFNDPRLRRFFDVPGNQDPSQGQGRSGNGGNGRNGNPRRGNRLPDQTQQGLGSGVVISADGYILTNNHVIEGADDVKVSIGESNKRYDAKVVGRDALADIAVLKIEPPTPLSPAVLGDSEQLLVGDVVLAIGNPFGVGQSVSRGIVSALSRGVGVGVLEDFIQTDAAINMGNSGGALIDTQGRLVGINSAILSRSGGFNGVGFAIPINLARSIAEQIVNTGKVSRGMLGVVPQDLDEDLISQFGTEKGALIVDVNPDTPAAKAGIKTSDVITKVNSTEIRDSRHLLLTVGQLAPDTQVTVEYLRDGKPGKVSVKLAPRPESALAGDERAVPTKDVGVLNGVTVGEITPQVRDSMNIPDHIRGAIVTEIDPDSPSARQGIRQGDVIRELERRPVKNAEEAVRLSEEIKGPKVLVLVWRNGGSQHLVIDESKK
ncbi:MAG TPA: Do family serine endopeptidase, partial [Opitutaceae bacterium]|nr:Do family serine endopeptidase [Opitutaceae bacterium]